MKQPMDKCAVIADKSKPLMLLSSHCWLYHCWPYTILLVLKSLMLYQAIVDWESLLILKPLMLISSHCWLRVIVDHKSYTYKAIKLQIKSSSYHLYIIQSSSCKLSHQAITYTLFSHQVANYKAIKLSFIHYSAIKLQITEPSSYHLYIIESLSCKLQSHQAITTYNIYTISWVFLSVIAEYFLLCLALESSSIQSFIVKYKQNIYFEVERYNVPAIIDKKKLCNETYIAKTSTIYIDRIDLSFHLSKMLNTLFSFFTEFLRV